MLAEHVLFMNVSHALLCLALPSILPFLFPLHFVHSDSCHLCSCCFVIRELKVCLSSSSLIVSLANSLIMFISTFLDLSIYNISHKIIPCGKATSLEELVRSICLQSVFCLWTFLTLDFACKQEKSFWASSLRKTGGRWCKGAVTPSCRDCTVEVWCKEKSRKSQGDNERSGGVGEMRNKAVHTVSDLKGLIILRVQTLWGHHLDQYQLQNASITSSLNGKVIKYNL